MPTQMVEPRRIIYDGRYISPRFPGVGRYSWGCLDALARALPNTEFVVLSTEETGALPKRPNVASHAVHAEPLSVGDQMRLLVALRGLGGDLFHTPHFAAPWGLGMPLINTIHDMIPLDYPASMPSRARRAAFSLAVRYVVNGSARVLTPSEATRERLRQRYGDRVESNVVVTSEGVDTRFHPLPDEEAVRRVRASLGFPQGYVLHVGGNRPHKNTMRLVEAFGAASLPLGLVFAGTFDARFPSPSARVEELGLSGRVRHLGFVPEGDLPVLYSAATFVVVPSLCEGFGLPLAEAFACGAPVLCHHASALPEVAGEAALLADCADLHSLATAMRRLADDAGLRANLSARGLARAAEFTWDRVAARIIAGAYRPILGAR